jgi:ribosomal-protein-alanine N-acetyltransferase
MMCLPDTSTLLVRPMIKRDIKSVMAIDKSSFSLPWSERSYRYDLTQNKTARMWVAELKLGIESYEVVGMVVMWIIMDEAHIGTIAVHPDHRRQGIAQKLMKKALEDAKKCGAKTITLEVRRSNQAAQAMYAGMGFSIVGTRPRYYKDNAEDALLMTVEI